MRALASAAVQAFGLALALVVGLVVLGALIALALLFVFALLGAR